MDNGKERVQEQKLSVVMIRFKEPGSAEFNLDVQNAGPAQMLAAAEFMRALAERQLNEQWSQQAMNQAKQQQAMDQVQQMLRRRP